MKAVAAMAVFAVMGCMGTSATSNESAAGGPPTQRESVLEMLPHILAVLPDSLGDRPLFIDTASVRMAARKESGWNIERWRAALARDFVPATLEQATVQPAPRQYAIRDGGLHVRVDSLWNEAEEQHVIASFHTTRTRAGASWLGFSMQEIVFERVGNGWVLVRRRTLGSG